MTIFDESFLGDRHFKYNSTTSPAATPQPQPEEDPHADDAARAAYYGVRVEFRAKRTPAPAPPVAAIAPALSFDENRPVPEPDVIWDLIVDWLYFAGLAALEDGETLQTCEVVRAELKWSRTQAQRALIKDRGAYEGITRDLLAGLHKAQEKKGK